MTLLSPFGDPVSMGVLGSVPARRAAVAAVPPDPPAQRGFDGSSTHRRRDVAGRLVRTLLGSHDEDTAPTLVELLDERVVTWTPSTLLRSRAALIEALSHSDDAIGEIDVVTSASIVAGNVAHVEWTVSGVFARAGFLNDDVLVEPSGRAIRVAGSSVATFADERVAFIRCYFDRLGILEQVLRPGPG